MRWTRAVRVAAAAAGVAAAATTTGAASAQTTVDASASPASGRPFPSGPPSTPQPRVATADNPWAEPIYPLCDGPEWAPILLRGVLCPCRVGVAVSHAFGAGRLLLRFAPAASTPGEEGGEGGGAPPPPDDAVAAAAAAAASTETNVLGAYRALQTTVPAAVVLDVAVEVIPDGSWLALGDGGCEGEARLFIEELPRACPLLDIGVDAAGAGGSGTAAPAAAAAAAAARTGVTRPPSPPPVASASAAPPQPPPPPVAARIDRGAALSAAAAAAAAATADAAHAAHASGVSASSIAAAAVVAVGPPDWFNHSLSALMATGTLLTPRHVLTSARALDDAGVLPLDAGRSVWFGPPAPPADAVRAIATATTHPLWERSGRRAGDVAVVTLASPAPHAVVALLFPPPPAAPRVAVNHAAGVPAAGSAARAAGIDAAPAARRRPTAAWAERGAPPLGVARVRPPMRSADVEVRPQTACAADWGATAYSVSPTLCTEQPAAAAAANCTACPGGADAGGPLFQVVPPPPPPSGSSSSSSSQGADATSTSTSTATAATVLLVGLIPTRDAFRDAVCPPRGWREVRGPNAGRAPDYTEYVRLSAVAAWIDAAVGGATGPVDGATGRRAGPGDGAADGGDGVPVVVDYEGFDLAFDRPRARRGGGRAAAALIGAGVGVSAGLVLMGGRLAWRRRLGRR